MTVSHASYVRRKIVNAVMLSLTGVCALLSVSVLFFILGYLVCHGASSLNWDFFTKLPTPVGETGGGMANAIVGSGKLILLATLFGIPDRILRRCISGRIRRNHVSRSWCATRPTC